MKIAILSDIHGNVPALEAVMVHIERWQPDQVIVNGDIVNRGPLSADAWQLISKKRDQEGWLVTRGNHEDYVVAWREPTDHFDDIQKLLYQTSIWTYEQLSADAIIELATLPMEISLFAPDGSELRATHASMGDNKNGMVPWNSADEIRAKIGTPPAVFVTSHTHRFFERRVDETLIVNSGSVGVPLDGSHLTGYAQVRWEKGHWSAELIRLQYDRTRTKADFTKTNFQQVGGPTAKLMYLEWLQARSHIALWSQEYHPLIVTKAVTPWDAVKAYFASLG